MSKRKSAVSCKVCVQRQKGEVELYEIRDEEGSYIFNVDQAKKIIAGGRPSIPVSEETIRQILAINQHEPRHLKHVDPSRPGIVVRRFGGLVLLDGVHRAARALQAGTEFRVYELTYEESLQCLVNQTTPANEARAIARRLRRVLKRSDEAMIHAEIECDEQVLQKVKAMLTPEENQRLRLRRIQRQ